MKLSRVAFISHEAHPIKSGGATLLADLEKEFKKLDIWYRTIVPVIGKESSEGYSSKHIFLPVFRKSDGGATKREIFNFFRAGFRPLRINLKELKVTHVYSLFVFPSGLLTLFSTINLRTHRTIIVDSIDLPETQDSPLRRNAMLRVLVRLSLLRADRILLIEGLEQEFRRFTKLPFETVKVGIPNRRQLKNSRNLANKAINITTVSRLIPRKNLKLSLRIIRELIDQGFKVNYAIIGDGPDFNRLKRYACELGIDTYVIFHGYLNSDATLKVLLESDFYLFNSFNEGVSASMLDAMSMGLPTIVSENCGNKLVLGKELSKLMVDSQEPKPYVDIIKSMINDFQYYEKTSLDCYKRSADYTWDKIIKGYLPK